MQNLQFVGHSVKLCSAYSLCLALCMTMPLVGQTPWETSPAVPAQLPATTTVRTDTTARPLPPPPPAASPMRRPRHVAIPQTANAVPQGGLSEAALKALESRLMNLGQAPAQPSTQTQGAPNPAGGLSNPAPNSLIPEALNLPGRTALPNSAAPNPGPNPAAPTGSTAKPPIPAASSQLSLPFPSLDELPLPSQSEATTPQAPVNLPTMPNLAGTIKNAITPGASSGGNSSSFLVGRGTNASVANPDDEQGPSKFEPGRLIAVVGSDHVLAGDLAHYVEPVIEKNRDRIPSKKQEMMIREQIMRQVLKSYVVTKAMHIEFFRDAAGAATPDKLEESKKMVTTRAREIFFEKQVPDMLKKYKVNDLRSLEAKLREKSMALSTMQNQFVEQILAAELERKYIPEEFEFSRQELLTYYQEHADEWQEPSRARWQQLTIRFDKHGGNRAEVDRLIKQLGNEIYLGGKSFESVAKQSSEGYNADEGGIQDWTTKGSLKSKPVEQTVFTIEINRLSKVIADEVGMHIVRVLEREEAHERSFAEAQSEIRQELSKARRGKELKKFHKTVLDRTPVWSLWPEDLDGKYVRPLSEALGDQALQR